MERARAAVRVWAMGVRCRWGSAVTLGAGPQDGPGAAAVIGRVGDSACRGDATIGCQWAVPSGDAGRHREVHGEPLTSGGWVRQQRGSIVPKVREERSALLLADQVTLVRVQGDDFVRPTIEELLRVG